MKNFKVGDKVYCPVVFFPSITLSRCIHTLVSTDNSERPIGLRVNEYGTLNLLPDGSLSEHVKVRLIHHATVANKCLLEKLHGVTFETPEGCEKLNDCSGYVPRGSD